MELLPAFLLLLAVLSANAAIREAKDEEFPFQVSIQNSDRRHLCGGAIITPKWVLSTRSCLESQISVKVAFGSADSNNPKSVINSHRIVVQKEFSLTKKSNLALVELENPIEFSNTVKQAGLPTEKAELRNTTKLSGWRISKTVSLPPSLFVNDVYYVIPKDCKTPTGSPVHLSVDEFCGMDEDNANTLFNLGTTVSKSAIILGILAREPLAAHEPSIYVKMSEHEEWIRGVLRTDAQHVHWVDDIPKDSATSSCVISVALIGISAILLRFI